ncbi:hypothetical protein G7Z17_g900 [Cylindrodendrum hubeiense]|uniref:Serine aminopeptidase S33 domain-containing protein n=1 Tax=Cylindrodendrum hubeiense TaxID=595255 RepID=A0A9P5HJB6_9HYPO|nr:hypothetical protein G7Z17_g900 [Cylindrodendrum hubeiense]
MASTRDVDIPTYDGLKLRGTLYYVGQDKPCIIMSSGWSGLRGHFHPDFAERFNAAGYGVLAYDNRCWGESEGLPRDEVDPSLQTRDYFDVFNFASTQPEVDAAKIVYWGSSMSGGNAICAAAVNKKIAGVILQVPLVSGEAITRTPGMSTSLFVLDRGKTVATGSHSKIANFPSSLEELMSGTSTAVLKDPEALQFTEEMEKRGMNWSKACTVQSLANAVLHEPAAYIHRISPTPMLMIVSGNDVVTQTHLQLEAFQKALEPKKLKLLQGVGHFAPYFGKTFEENVKAQVGFLNEIFGG